MQISNISIAAPTCSHVVITATVGGQIRQIHVTQQEFDLEPGEAVQAFIARLRSFKLENNYTFAQMRSNLAGKVFEI